MLIGDLSNEEKKTMKIKITDELTKRQMLSILKFIYTREFDVETQDIIPIWYLSNKFLLEDLQVECETLIIKNISIENVKDIKQIAEMVNSKRIIELCDDLEKSKN
jgi:hypothetical protein